MIALPDDFLLGAATSSHQVEGDNRLNDWWDWEQVPGHVADGTRSGDAAGWWAGRAEEDLARAAELGHDAHRMSLEWSRLEPEAGRFDEAAFDRYRAILDAATERGLKVALTLSHFTLPRWAARLGGWRHPELPALFEGFAARAARALGDDRVHLWATLNEPSILAYMAYAGDRWPPGARSMPACFGAIRRMLEAHARGYRALHEALDAPSVGIVLNCPWFLPARPRSALDRAVCAAQDWAFNGVTLHALRTGALRPPLGLGETIEGLAGALDWVGLNFYGRLDVRFDPRRPDALFGRHVQEPTVRTEHVDWGQPSPEGMVAQLARLSALGVPLYVTENGTWDHAGWPDFLVDHVRALAEARRDGLDVRGYFAWSLVDNFEWAEGWTTRFGMLALDRETGARRVRPHAERFAALCRSRTVPEAASRPLR